MSHDWCSAESRPYPVPLHAPDGIGTARQRHRTHGAEPGRVTEDLAPDPFIGETNGIQVIARRGVVQPGQNARGQPADRILNMQDGNVRRRVWIDRFFLIWIAVVRHRNFGQLAIGSLPRQVGGQTT